MILDQAALYGWDNLILWKMNLQGAFSSLRINSDCVSKFAFALTDDLTLLHTAGMFGWTDTPALRFLCDFAVVGRMHPTRHPWRS